MSANTNGAYVAESSTEWIESDTSAADLGIENDALNGGDS